VGRYVHLTEEKKNKIRDRERYTRKAQRKDVGDVGDAICDAHARIAAACGNGGESGFFARLQHAVAPDVHPAPRMGHRFEGP